MLEAPPRRHTEVSQEPLRRGVVGSPLPRTRANASSVPSMLQPLILLPLLLAPAHQPPSPAHLAVSPREDSAERYEALLDEEERIVEEWRAEVRRIRDAPRRGGVHPGIPMSPDFAPLVPKFQQAALDYAETDDAVQFLAWILQRTSGAPAQQALITLTRSHASSKALVELGPSFQYLERMAGEDAALDFLDAVKAENEHPDVLGWVALTELKSTIESADLESDRYLAARKQLMGFIAKARSKELKQQIRRAIDLRESFGVGCTAPDIVGPDLDGVEFKLSDYAGKVIFLDFWGDW